MPLKSYIDNDPRVKVVNLFSQACFNIAVGMLVLSFTQAIIHSFNFAYFLKIDSSTGIQPLAKYLSEGNTSHSINDPDNSLFLECDSACEKAMKSLFVSIGCILFAIGIGFIGVRSAYLIKSISFAEIENRMNDERNFK